MASIVAQIEIMAQIDYEKKLKAFSTILPHFLICIQIEDRGTVTLSHVRKT
jgi:hypothetical protein